MTLADVNVLVAAFRTGHADHMRCRSWLNQESVLPRFGLAPLVLSAVIRVATNRRVFPDPSPLRDVLDFVDRLSEKPGATIIEPGPRHWQIFMDLLRDTQATGDRVPDAWFAALAIEHGCTWVTLDRGFARFKDLQTKAP